MLIQTFVAAGISGILYRLGGWEKGNKAIRRFGCPFVAYGLLWCFRPFQGLQGWLLVVLAYILSTLALSTYHDYLAPDKKSENWLCWLVTGIVYGLAAFPLFWAGIHWYSIIIRAILLGAGIMLLREHTGSDIVEEAGSGFLFCFSIPILLL